VIRKDSSELPIHRYAGDYLPLQERQIVSPFLGDLTKKWMEGLMQGVNQLPSLESSLDVHKLMFDWLSLSKKHTDKFPIT